MPKGPVRRAQLIAPFGVGAMMVVRDGTSVVTAGLDHWFEREDTVRHDGRISPEEFMLDEWRLKRVLKVNHFRLPPDFRIASYSNRPLNTGLTVPCLRFPAWHVCPGCNRLDLLPLSMRGREKCRECLRGRRIKSLIQVPFVAMCDYGHLQDFPWREWVHGAAHQNCERSLKLIAMGGTSLFAQKIVCECGLERNLGSITTFNQDGSTYLSQNLEKGTVFYCQGKRPWLGTDESEPCPRQLRGSLRSASNIYFADIRSAIYLPRGGPSLPADLLTILEGPVLLTAIKLLAGAGQRVNPSHVRRLSPDALRVFSDEQISEVLELILADESVEHEDQRDGLPGDDRETGFRRAEFEILRQPREEEQLLIRPADLSRYRTDSVKFLSRLMLVHRLRETRAFAGFTRVFPESDLSLDRRLAMLRRSLVDRGQAWLPAYVVYGEGLFLEVREDRLTQWEQRDKVKRRVAGMVARYQRVQRERRLRERQLGARYVLLHTLSHLLMNRLTFECGYSSASLRERLFISENPAGRMAGLLIYTAAGDAEGTLGGLVRMGAPGRFEDAITAALESAKWCSADPVCMEIGRRGGQGPDSCNLAACHNCALVPETACEDFNRFLDRALVIGDVEEKNLGYFVD